jgi:molybdenum cofactor biosynthesis protein B
MPINNLKKFIPINISILTISDTRTEATDTSGQILAKKVREKGHALLHKEIVKTKKN